MRVLVVNAGSSSLWLVLLEGDDTVLGAHEMAASQAEVDAGAVRVAAAPAGLLVSR